MPKGTQWGTAAGPKAGPEMDALVLELVMGWRWVPLDCLGGARRRVLWDPAWPPPLGDDFRELSGGRLLPWDAPRPSTDVRDAFRVQERIAERRLEYPYTVALTAMLLGAGRKSQDWREAWAAATATPAQRCAAALRAVGLTTDDTPPSRPTGRGLARPKLNAPTPADENPRPCAKLTARPAV